MNIPNKKGFILGYSGVKLRFKDVILSIAVSAAVVIPGTNWLIKNQAKELETRLQDSPAGQLVEEEVPGADDFKLVEPNEGPDYLEFSEPNGNQCRMPVKATRTPVGGKGGGWALEVDPLRTSADNISCER